MTTKLFYGSIKREDLPSVFYTNGYSMGWPWLFVAVQKTIQKTGKTFLPNDHFLNELASYYVDQ